ncbi:hypothetical protein GAYE_SCF02G2071 [Galdieria yellowstonensis]|uniref:Bax inhibitor-1 n=1 Tax=Galdieria yellowstonensis TaxID=3028027 RepID=A0AAV9I9V6_9RHOD|nr:hypothetical protein GAYE_SCF02G2071 [Galdieria yellowstonensis]
MAQPSVNKFPSYVASHLKRVYWTLSVSVALMFIGMVVHTYTSIGYTLVPQVLVFASLLLFVSFPRNPQTEKTRKYLLYCFSTMVGCELGPLVEVAFERDPDIVLNAVSGTAVVFLCFTGAAVVAERKSYLFLGGFLSSVLSILLLFSVFSFIIPLKIEEYVQLYLGLVMFVGYVLFDTQLIIERAYNGSTDAVSDAVTLFIDFVGIFVRILVALLKNSSEKESKEKRKRK